MNVQQLQIDEIYERYQAKSVDTVWIDVRQPEEWAEGTIPGVKRIALGELDDHLTGLDKDKTYIMVCRSGARSDRAAQMMVAQGFNKLFNFDGGMLAWKEAGYETEIE